jgi:hypothetical protein
MNKAHAREELESLYDVDFFEWTQRAAEDLRQGTLSPADLEHLAEEVADMGKRDRREVESRATVLIMHLLKWIFQPERRNGSSWIRTIDEQRRRLRRVLRDSPSLQRVIPEELPELYRDAALTAAREMQKDVKLPRNCPFTPEQIIEDWWPEN